MTAVYAELDAITNFSFLEGGSHPAEMVETAAELGLAALGVADRNTLAGVVRAHAAARRTGLPLRIGARLAFTDGGELIVYPRDRAAYARLCRLLSVGKSGLGGEDPPPTQARIPKGACHLVFEQAARFGEGLIGLVRAPEVPDAAFEARLAAWRRAWPDRLLASVAPFRDGRDRERFAATAAAAGRCGLDMLAVNAALYHHPDRRRLQDVLTCIREKTTLDAAGSRLVANAERHLKAPAEMARLFQGFESALERTLEVVEACRFSLDELSYAYPDEPTPAGRTADAHLKDLALQGARRLYPDGVPPRVTDLLRKELALIEKLGYAPYFLTVHDIVSWARREHGILCQGRGSAANSVVCFCLGVTSVDPAKQDVLFERFISEARSEPPDIDVDFEHERRELVMQYVYARYGRERAAICATVIHYRPRSAIREVGKVLGLTEDVTGALAGTVWGSGGSRIETPHVDRAGFRRTDPRLALALEISEALIGFPRHLSQHVGGFVLTRGPLVETVPVANGAMDARTFIEWDKDDLDELRIMKVDVLALGMLTAIRRGFDLIAAAHGRRYDLVSVPRERPEVYDMLCAADSIGVFQVESRAQMSMLPRLRPRVFYDLVVQVAIVRPGPIQGDMVHPYLNRRAEARAAAAAGRPFVVPFPAPSAEHGDPDELRRVLEKTLGVPLFQEQAMRIAMEAARFTGDEANGLRRAMATFRRNGAIGAYEDMMISRMVARGYAPDFARNCFNQIRGFGDYGFPESHAAAFAQLVYVSAWMKRFYPDAFAAALLNSQPMGFYAPAQIIRDAREHGVEVRPVDVNHSDWDCTLEPGPAHGAGRALRLGFRQATGFRKDWAEAISQARRVGGPFTSPEDLRRRAGLAAVALDALAGADAVGSLGLGRREGLWAARGLPRAGPAPLFEAAGLEEGDGAAPSALPPTPLAQSVADDYAALRLSLKAHPLVFLRDRLAGLGAACARDVVQAPDGARVSAAGVVLVRQRPGSAKGVMFLTLEDETGVVNVVVWPKIFERFRPQLMGARLLLVRGRVERAADSDGRVVHLVAASLEDRTEDLALLTAAEGGPSDPPGARRGPPAAARRHPRSERILPRSRDFH